MKRIVAAFIGLVILLVCGWLWFARAQKLSAEAESPASEPVASVKTAPATRETLALTISAYGSVTEAPGGLQEIVAPFECRVRRVYAETGQQVRAGDVLLEVQPSPEALLLLETARNALAAAEKDRSNTKELLDLNLATRQDLLRAEQVMQDASLNLSSLEERGLGKDGRIRAPNPGIVGRVDVQQGSPVATGSPFLDLSAADRLEVRLGVEPGDVSAVGAGQPVSLELVDRQSESPVSGHIRLVSRTIDPTTGLVDALVALSASDGLLLGDYVRARIEIAAREVLAVPRAAVLREGDQHVVFTVKNQRAVKHVVQPGQDDGTVVEVTGGDLQPGDPVVVLGNYELTDSMSVTLESSL